MEPNPSEKKPKAKTTAYSSVHMHKDLKKRIYADLAKVNKKDFGRNVKADEYIAFAITLITPDHLRQLQENSLSNADRLERDYRAYVSKFGSISKDEYLGKRLNGEIGSQSGSPDAHINNGT